MKRGTIAFAVGALIASGCSSHPSARDGAVVGARTDVKTAPGAYDGFRVAYPCSTGAADVGVVGDGHTTITKVEDMARVGGELYEKLRDLKSVQSAGGYGLQCEAGVGTRVVLGDWREVDEVIRRTGALLQEQDVAIAVAISVEGVPSAQ